MRNKKQVNLPISAEINKPQSAITAVIVNGNIPKNIRKGVKRLTYLNDVILELYSYIQ